MTSLAICAYGFHQANYTLNASDLAIIENLDASKLQSMIGVEYGSDVAFKEALRQNLGDSLAKSFEGDLIQKAGTLPSTLIFSVS